MVEISILILVALVIIFSSLYINTKVKLKEVGSQRDYSLDRNIALTKELMYLEEQLTLAHSKVAHQTMVIDSFKEVKND